MISAAISYFVASISRRLNRALAISEQLRALLNIFTILITLKLSDLSVLRCKYHFFNGSVSFSTVSILPNNRLRLDSKLYSSAIFLILLYTVQQAINILEEAPEGNWYNSIALSDAVHMGDVDDNSNERFRLSFMWTMAAARVFWRVFPVEMVHYFNFKGDLKENRSFYPLFLFFSRLDFIFLYRNMIINNFLVYW